MSNNETLVPASERKYLNLGNKIGYGMGDMAANMIIGILQSFYMLYLTDAVGMQGAIIGTLMLVSRIFDGISDVFFGNLMDKTHTKMGKARPWMLYSQIGNSIFLILCFTIPLSWGKTAQYAFFFIVYTALNAIFYTACNIAYSSLTALITRNNLERVEIGVFRFIFSFATQMILANITLRLVAGFGGGAGAWRTVAIIYALISFAANTISVLSVKELPEEDGAKPEEKKKDDVGLIEAIKILFHNKYFIYIALVYICFYLQSGIQNGAGVYYFRDVLGNENLIGTFSIVNMLPMALGLLVMPTLVRKMNNMYKLNLYGFILCSIGKIGCVVAGMAHSVPGMIVTMAIAGFGMAPLTATLNALIASATELTYKMNGVHVEGAMFSASSVGIKVGSGLGSAISGLLLTAGGYMANAAVQPQSHLNMMTFEYLFVPMIVVLLMTFILSKLNVEKANKDWDEAHPEQAA